MSAGAVDDMILELDSRRRASLGKIGRPEHRRYLVTEEPDGTIVLRPAVVMTELEHRFITSPAARRIASADPASLVRRRPARG